MKCQAKKISHIISGGFKEDGARGLWPKKRIA